MRSVSSAFLIITKTRLRDEAVAEDEASWEDTSQTFMEVPNELVPAVRELLAKKVA